MNGNGIARGATRPDDGPGSMDRKTSVVGVWTGFLETKAGRWVKERTGFVENLGSGSPKGSRALIFWTLALPSPIMFLLLFAAPGAAFMAYLLLAAALGLLFIMFWQAYNGSEQQDRDAFDTNRHLMDRREAGYRLSGWSLSRKADNALPATRAALDGDKRTRGESISPRRLGVRIGECHGRDAWISTETPLYVLASTRTGKTTSVIIPIVMEAPGPVITTSSRMDVIEATLAMRRDGFRTSGREDYAGGSPRHEPSEVWIFDPTGICTDPAYAPYAINWDPVAACIDDRKALNLASAIVGTADLKGDNANWAHIATTIVRSLLTAGAVSGKGLDDVYFWSQSMDGINIAANILKNSPDADLRSLAAPLRALSEDDQRTRSNKMLSVSTSFEALGIKSIRQWLRPNPGKERFDMRRFLSGRGTVYMLSPLRSTQGEAAANEAVFASMFLSEARDTAREMAAESGFGKLEPPLSLVLDEVANITPWEGLPQLFTAGSGDGIWSVAVVQARNAARAAFGDGEEKQMWDNSQKLIGPGQSTSEVLQGISDLVGEYDENRSDLSFNGFSGAGLLSNLGILPRTERRKALPVDSVRRIPMGRFLLVSSNARPAAVTTVPYWRRGWHRCSGEDARSIGRGHAESVLR